MLCISSCRLVTVWCDFLSAWRTFFATPFQASPLATLSTSLHLSETSLYSTFIFERWFTRHRISGWQLFFFLLSHFIPHPTAFWPPSFLTKKTAISFIVVPLYKSLSLSLSLFLSLSLSLSRLSRCFNCFDSDSPRAGGCCYLFVCLKACLG